MTGNLSRTVLRGAGARESARLPDLTKGFIVFILKNRKTYLFPVKRGRFFLLQNLVV
ncbi:hypothetical protein SAMN04487777_1013 [Priestia aryabhattai B8W22]|nr:hypothetical protein SAMN04487777_1013 [Priestia aryabhattai B8W22]